tara:strand:- start:27765 stop:28829 length:1065 start_codon:yes stop_codon:yes gene_type:complete
MHGGKEVLETEKKGMNYSAKAAGADDIVDPRSWENESAYQIANYHVPSVWHQTEGEGVVVGVIDSGCDINHVDLTGNLLPGKAFVNPDSPMSDEHGHGTFVTGIICAKRNGHGVHGVAPKAQVRPYRCLNAEAGGSYDDILNGIHQAIDDGVDIINFSIYMSANNTWLTDAVRRAYEADIPMICAAGNFGLDEHSDVVWPAAYRETIAVGAVDRDVLKADFSNTGPNLDFVAPGVDVRSTFPGSEYRRSSGTSFATPWITGIVALMIAKHRKFGGRTPVNTVEDVREHLRKTSIDLGDAGKDAKYGNGIIDVQAAIGQIGRKVPLPIKQSIATRYYNGSGVGFAPILSSGPRSR